MLSLAYIMLPLVYAGDFKTTSIRNNKYASCTFRRGGRSRPVCGESQVGLPIAFRDDRVNGLEPGPHQRLVSVEQ